MNPDEQARLVYRIRSGASAGVAAVEQRDYWDSVDELVDINATDDEGLTVMHGAATNPTILSDVLARGGDPNARGRDNVTPLIVAAQHGAVESIKILLDAGADPNVLETRFGNTALWFATMRGWALDAIPLLRAAGADPDQANLRGDSPRSLLEQMISQGSSPETSDLASALRAAMA